ncbi:MAG: hypothetical protein HYV93_03285 [Candidatus Rokubacteria bacterium]|nr:hypothetical protein [Candidatus Rokubacteria bacterium]
MTRIVDEIHAGRNERARLTQERKRAAVEMKHAVASLRGTFAADLAGAHAAWVGAGAAGSRGLAEPGPAGAGAWRAVAERQDVLREAAAERRRAEAERRARDAGRLAPKGRGRHRPR